MATTILWLRNDLRLDDHPALLAAAERGAVVPVVVWAPQEEGEWPPGAASRWWLHHSLASLDGELRARGSRLVVRKGATLPTLEALVRETGADRVVWSRRYEPAAAARDQHVRAALEQSGVEVETFNASLLHEPWEVETGAGGPYRVFTPFWKACLAQGMPAPHPPAPTTLRAPERWPDDEGLESLALLPEVRWDKGLAEAWTPGPAGARAALDRFVRGALDGYALGRDIPSQSGTSRLSPHLHFGEIGPREVAAACAGRDAARFLAEIGWREFGHHLIHHFPTTPREPLRPEFARFPWSEDGDALEAWRRGRTGYPFVDAAMRELWHTGWMHNRPRMVVASFLVKDLLVPWQRGAEWFWETLVDADLANNTLGWQWTAGCGADAAPYFRVFNPFGQGERYDPDGAYVKRWAPELSEVPAEWIHRPWEAPPDVLEGAGVVLGETYPHPIVDHAQARRAALRAYEAMRGDFEPPGGA